MNVNKVFQSTLPVGGATLHPKILLEAGWISIHAPRGGSDHYGMDRATAYNISIHAPRGGSDVSACLYHAVLPYFNPRSPWGERLAGKA